MSDVPYLRRQAKKRIGDTGRASEKRFAKRVGGRQRPNSGAMAGAKGDVLAGTFLVEAKSSTGDSISLSRKWLAKVAQEARQEGKQPALSVTFTYADGRPIPDGAWVMIPERLWNELKEEQSDGVQEQR